MSRRDLLSLGALGVLELARLVAVLALARCRDRQLTVPVDFAAMAPTPLVLALAVEVVGGEGARRGDPRP